MSFDYNPFKHIELVQDEHSPQLWYWYCHGCGAEGELHSMHLNDLYENYREHLIRGHARFPESFEGWSIL